MSIDGQTWYAALVLEDDRGARSIQIARQKNRERHVVKSVAGRAPIVATGSFGLTIEDKADFAARIYDTGIAAVILITGHYANVEDNDDILLHNFEKMFRLTRHIPM